MNVLSLFDGVSACHLALERVGFKVEKYYTAEIDKYASKVSHNQYPDQNALGDVTKWQEWEIDWGSIDLVTGGFPCQAWSLAGKQLGDRDSRGALFWTMLDIIKKVLEHNPKAYFLMENVKMKKEFEEYITTHTERALGKVEKHLINSALVSAQNRNRYYWTNIPGITQPEDRGILLIDVLEDGVVDRDKSHCIDANYYKGGNPDQYFNKSRRQLVFGGAIRGRYLVDGKRQDHKMKTAGLTTQRLEIRKDGKTNTLTTVQKDNVVVFHKGVPRGKYKGDAKEVEKSPTLTSSSFQHNHKISVRDKSKTVRSSGRGSYDRHEWDSVSDCHYRKLTVRECERLQTFPDSWTGGISNTQRYKALGNAWTVDVVAHIFRHIKGV